MMPQVLTANRLSVGEVVLLFSTKQDPNKSHQAVVQKVLMSDATEASAEDVLRWYALRWQVELLFKEMKSQLGMCQYQVRDFDRVAGWVRLCLLAFCYLEHSRRALLRQASAKQQAYWRAARSQALRAWLRQQVEREDLHQLIRLARTPPGRERLNELLQAGDDDPAHPRGRRKAG